MDKPNVVIIMTDQQRADLCKREGFPLDTTPFLDLLARRGVWFNKAYTSMPVCAPARVSMLTGRWPSAHRVRTNHNIEDAYYTEDLFDVFRRHGYSTALIGKNHSHLSPEKCDFWFECGHLGIHGDGLSQQERAFNKWMEETHFHMSLEPAPFPLECQIPYRLVSKAEEWVKSIGRRPFLLWLSFPEPHNPYQVPEPYWSMFPPEILPLPRADESILEVKGFKYCWCRACFELAFPGFKEQIPRARASYLGMLRLLDDQIRRFVEFLDAQRLLEDTIIVFLSDHGDFVGEYGLLRKGPGLAEVLVRIPLQFFGPGIRRFENPHPAHVSIVDIMPTLCEAVGIQLPDGVQGRSLWPLLTGEGYPEGEFNSAYVEHGFGGLHYTGDEDLDPTADGLTVSTFDGSCTLDKANWGAFDCLNSWTQSGTMAMVRKEDWKIIFDMDGREQLYNIIDDPLELCDFSTVLAQGVSNDVSALKNDLEEVLVRCAGMRGKEFARRLCHNGISSIAMLCRVERELIGEMLKWRLRVQDSLPLPRRRYVLKRHPRGYWEAQSSNYCT